METLGLQFTLAGKAPFKYTHVYILHAHTYSVTGSLAHCVDIAPSGLPADMMVNDEESVDT